MIHASFDRHGRDAAIAGAYQYDTGQRLRMRGLPAPWELEQMDEPLDGGVTVQAHFSRMGDSQTESRLASWDEAAWAWTADVPDEFLTLSEAVHVYVYVYYGEAKSAVSALDGGAAEPDARAMTMYEGVFTPVSRPAPLGTVTDEQQEAWETYAQEIDLALVSAGTAAENARGSAQDALEAAADAGEAARDAQDAAGAARAALEGLMAQDARFAGMTVQTTRLPAGSPATAALRGHVLEVGVPQGARGATGNKGPSGPADIALSFADGVLTVTTK